MYRIALVLEMGLRLLLTSTSDDTEKYHEDLQVHSLISVRWYHMPG